jgi:hypothetical protein
MRSDDESGNFIESCVHQTGQSGGVLVSPKPVDGVQVDWFPGSQLLIGIHLQNGKSNEWESQTGLSITYRANGTVSKQISGTDVTSCQPATE